jgi:membrane-bound serine protease (ClpP class)
MGNKTDRVQGPGRPFSRLLLWTALALAGFVLFSLPNAAQTERTAVVLEIDGAIGPAMSDYLSRGIAHAQERNAGIVVIRMDTPGGLDTSMRAMNRAILAAPMPVATFVHPSGARAASAGTYILYASHIAAMAPGTTLGAATPVQIGGGGGLPFGQQDEDDTDDHGNDNGEANETSAPQPGTAMERKVIEDAVAYIRGFAELRDRNADWAERAVREAASLSANQAAAENVVDFVARDVADLLAQAHGRTVSVAGNDVTLNTSDLPVETYDPDWRTRLLQVITNPNVALILMMIGIYGLIFEFMNPGALVPGTIGAICLLIGLYSMAVLPVNYAGAALMLLGIGLMIAEAFAPSFGVMGIGGAIAFILGAMILMDPNVPGFQLAWPVVGAIALTTLAFSMIVVRMAWTSHHRGVVSGREYLKGARGKVLDWRKDGGFVMVQGERWKAVSQAALRKDQPVKVIGLDGLTLDVVPDDTEEAKEN